jgi:hypothetical protein
MDGIHCLFQKKLGISDVNRQQSKMIVRSEDFDRFVEVLRGSREHIENATYSPENIERGIELTVLDFGDGAELPMKLKLKDQGIYYVFQKGWNKFVKSRALKAGDTVHFLWRARDEQILIDYQRTREPRGKV